MFHEPYPTFVQAECKEEHEGHENIFLFFSFRAVTNEPQNIHAQE
jgi:hypothetical protein